MAAGIDGKWRAKFDTQIGEQHYTYDFKSDGGKLTGTAANDMGSPEIKDGVIEGDTVSFVEIPTSTATPSALNTREKFPATKSSLFEKSEISPPRSLLPNGRSKMAQV
jgi:hypothetical protein